MNLLSVFFQETDGGRAFLTLGGTHILMMFTVCLIIGAVLAVLLALKEAKKLGIATSHVKNGLLIGVPSAIVLARIVYIALNWSTFDEIWGGAKFTTLMDIQDGGLSAVGALLVAVVIVAVFAKKYKINALKILDVMAPAILVIQIFACFGNFFSGTNFGSPVEAEFLAKFLPNFVVQGMNIGQLGTYYNPLFLYEAGWLILGLAVILVARRMRSALQIGAFFGIYLVWYGLGSAFITELHKFEATEAGIYVSIALLVGGVIYLAVKHVTFKQQSYFHAVNEIKEKSLQCYVFDLDQTIVNAEKLINTAYEETLNQSHRLSIYDDPRVALDDNKLKEYLRFTKENHEVLSRMYPGVHYTLGQIAKSGNEIILISKLPASIIALKIHHFQLAKYISRFINSSDIAKLGQQYAPAAVMVFSSDEKVINFAAKNGFKTAFCRFANMEESGIVADHELRKLAEAEYLV